MAAVRARLADARPLTPAEIGRVLDAVRQRLASAPFRLTIVRGFGPELLLDSSGQLRRARANADRILTITDYTGQPARSCRGAAAAGTLVVEYRQAGSGWSVTARASTPMEPGQPIADLVSGAVALGDAGLAADGRTRALRAAWSGQPARVEQRSPGGGSIAFHAEGPGAAGTQQLVVDVAAVRPLRWELTAGPPDRARPIAYSFEYKGVAPIELPATGLAPPDCVDPERGGLR